MAELRLVKAVSGEFLVGEDDDGNLKDVAGLQVVPQQGGSVSLTLIPLGFPFEQQLGGGIVSKTMILYEIKDIPIELRDRYLELRSNITIPKSETNGKIIL